MLDVQNRLPTPGKENRVKITQDSGAVVEGVLSYADDATQDGTFWNRSTAQLLQGDIRTYPVREGQSIAAGDVVNVGRELLSGSEQTYGDLPVGSTIQINENGSPVDYLVVHQGNPDPDLYDASCDGTWLLRKDIAENRVWDAGDSNQYADSDINDYLNGDWLDRYDSTTLSNIKQVKIPYFVGGGSSTVNSGANGLSVKAFLIGAYEIGLTTADSSAYPEDGGKLDYFISGMSSSAKNKRIANYEGGIASGYYTRSARTDNNDIHIVAADATMAVGQASHVTGIRPCIIISSSSFIGDAPIYGPETVYKDVVPQDNVENVIASVQVTNTDIVKLSDTESAIAFSTHENNWSYAKFAIIDNTGKIKSSIKQLDGVHAYGYMKPSINRIDDTHCSYVYNANGNMRGYIVSNDLSLSSQFSIVSGYGTNYFDSIFLDSSILFFVYDDNGIKSKTFEISQNTIVENNTVYSLSNNTGANYISACRLPDEGGNKRVCICFSDAGDGNKGKAVIATISADNAVTFGDVVTVNTSTSSVSHCAYGNGIVLTQLGQYYFALSDSLSILDSVPYSDIFDGVAGTGFTEITSNGVDFVVFGSATTVGNTNEFACVVSYSSSNIVAGSKFGYARNVQALSACFTEDNNLIAAYADGNNSNYGTTTILTVEGNEIAGSFLDNSQDAIALADGTGGQEIPVGFGGYCECPGVTEGQTIDSSGVSAVAVKNGWLHITPQYKNAVFGSFVYNHDAEPTKTVNLGFKPSIVLIYNEYNNTSEVAISGSPGDGNHIPMVLTRLYTSGKSYISDDGFVFYSSVNSSINQNLYYVAFR